MVADRGDERADWQFGGRSSRIENIGTLFGCAGKRHKAQSHVTVAAAMYHEMGMHFYREQAATALKALA